MAKEMKQMADGLWIPDTGETCYSWTITEIGIPGLLMDTLIKQNKPINNVIHAGGNIGIYALEFAKRAKNVYVFEPVSENFSVLSINCATKDNIFLYKAALGDTHTPINMINEAADKQCGAWRVETNSGNVPTLMIDDLNISNVSIIHLDIEGFEFFAFKGAEETIKRCKPLLAFEILSHSSHYDYTESDLFKYIVDLGYNSYMRYGNEIMFTE